jgi:probable rRNA maturation factor
MSPRQKKHPTHPRRSSSSPGFRVPNPVVHVGYALPRPGVPSAISFRQWVTAALAGARHASAVELSIRIVGSREGRSLNRQYRGRDYATNVLSFSAELPTDIGSPLLGDIVIAAPVVAREAREQDKSLRDHYAHLTVHGVLHLLGYDHQREREAAKMEQLETRILATLGIADPYVETGIGAGS